MSSVAAPSVVSSAPPAPPEQYLSPETGNFDLSSLSLKDLLEARESFHVHLSRKKYVIGTAVGRYLIRCSDPDKDDANKAFAAGATVTDPVKDGTRSADSISSPGVAAHASKGPRRIDDVVVRPWSWPCVIVFVSQWQPREAFYNNLEDYIPPFLYMRDGRVIPTCVVEAKPSEVPAEASVPQETTGSGDPESITSVPRGMLRGGGAPLFTKEQHQERFGTVACLVTDGANAFALTAAHVAGQPGTAVSCDERSGRIGQSDPNQIKKRLFSDTYDFDNLPSVRTYCVLDAGLVKLDDVRQWTPTVRGLGYLGDPVDLSSDTLSLRHIGLPLRGFGAASGPIKGQVLALFFRYRTLAGYDYVADLLIGPRPGETLPTHPGDSGTLFVFDAPAAVPASAVQSEAGLPDRVEAATRMQGWRPVAMQWGGQRFVAGAANAPAGTTYPFAMATNFSSILRQLDVELIRQGDLGLPEYWGEIGHFTIGEKATSLAALYPKLRELMQDNRQTIGFDDRIIAGDDETPGFVPLSDVPDLVWKPEMPRRGQPLHHHPGERGHKDNPTHSANVEFPADGIAEQIATVPLTPKAWSDLYHKYGLTRDFMPVADKNNPPPYYQSERGSLPFRVRQIWEELVKFAKAGQVAEYVCAAGILAHYVGDACQPLHGTLHFNDEGCHSPYETAMIGQHRRAVIDSVTAALNGRTAQATIGSGADAALATMRLIKRVQGILPWKDIVDSFVQAGKPRGTSSTASAGFDQMWQDLGVATGKCMAEGALLLADLWQSAWKAGNAETTIAVPTEAISYDKLQALFVDTNFLPSFALEEYPASFNDISGPA